MSLTRRLSNALKALFRHVENGIPYHNAIAIIAFGHELSDSDMTVIEYIFNSTTI